jgi:hypothetical protein
MDTKNNTGIKNSGDYNSGSWNSGDYNSGNWNSGNWNSGDSNSGNSNSGHYNSGNWNSGNSNSGGWNSGDRNSGYLNTNKPTVRMFNKDTGMTFEEIYNYIPNWFYFDLTEKENIDEITEGHLKVYDYKEAWRRSWNNASEEDRKKTLKLPNWDNEIFLEITGIDVEKELNQPKVKEYNMDEVAEALGVDVKELKIKKD